MPLTGRLAEPAAEVSRRLEVAWGHRPPDLVLRGARVLLGSGEVLPRDVAIAGERIAAVAEDLVAPGEATLDVTGMLVVPGYVEPHTHVLGPLSVGSYASQALVRGTACVVTDDAFSYTFLSPEQHAAMLDVSEDLPLLLRWSLRADPRGRSVPRAALGALLERPDVAQLGEVFSRAELAAPDDELAGLLALARAAGRRIEGHTPGGSAWTLGAAAAAGITADHEARRADEVVERLRAGLWTPLRHNAILPDVPEIVPELLERGVSLERTSFTIDWALPPWIACEGMVDGAIAAALAAGMPAAEAYASATRRPATYLGLDAHVGLVAPGRLASLNVLADASAPRPVHVVSRGRQVVRDRELVVPVEEVPWDGMGAPGWSRRAGSPVRSTYALAPDDPEIHLEAASMVRPGPGPGGGPPVACVAIDPVGETSTRAALFGMPAVRALVSTLTPSRLLVAVGAEPAALDACVAEVIALGGGIGLDDGTGVRCLPLPVGGVIATAPFETVQAFWTAVEQHLRGLGHAHADPLSTLLYLASESLPGPRFTARGLVETRSQTLLRPATPVRWS